MALVLLEEVLMGLEEAKDSLEQAVATLVSLAEDLTPDLADPWKEVIETDVLRPLEKRAARLDTLLEEIATQ
ncbi:MAG: hypothetical protein OEU26_28135 [Candidatus Tectomicrobia bacterium]|nr:hypothetical protein [Candidatus Tectomicrobia bacterium]